MSHLSDFLPERQVKQLREHYITTVDDLYTVFEEDRRAVSRLLELSEDDTVALTTAIRSAASPSVIEALSLESDIPRRFVDLTNRSDSDSDSDSDSGSGARAEDNDATGMSTEKGET
jgi:hypothetical protein